MSQPRILAFAGSNRAGSFNRKALAPAIAGAEAVGAEVTVLDLKAHPLPLYDADLESAEGVPENARKLQRLFAEHDGLLIASPEYNGLITPLVKNTLDWISRAPDDVSDPYEGKVAGILSASPGALGGLRGLNHLRTLLTNLGVLVLPAQVAVSSAHEVFAEDGTLTNERRRSQLVALGRSLAETLRKLSV